MANIGQKLVCLSLKVLSRVQKALNFLILYFVKDSLKQLFKVIFAHHGL